VAPSQEIFQEIRKAAAIKPVIASMGTIATSGGYYIAAAATGSLPIRAPSPAVSA
jgi:protease IV